MHSSRCLPEERAVDAMGLYQIPGQTTVGNVSTLDCGKQFCLSIVPPIADSDLQAGFPPPFRHLGSPCNYAGLFLT